ncbi:hypothetical protein TWF718_007191 [Orbilia javanica]|uniref:NACHT domain-containing protein n=1 Tax=Orbilia javanica TaxID=47235 RepID=A0AAN8RD25_9PEZI
MDQPRDSTFNNTNGRIAFQGTIINHGYINTADNQDPAERLRARKKEVLRRLYKTSYREHKDRNPDRIPGTCEWFVAHERFQEWQESRSKMLWVSADPGCGKSVLAKHLIDSILTTTEWRTTCYFFFKDDVDDQKSPVNALCSILHQIFTEKSNLLSENILEQIEDYGEGFTTSFPDLWRTLFNVARNNGLNISPNGTKSGRDNEIVCILDAVDECESNGRSRLLKALRKLDDSSSDLNLKFLLTSRPYREIRQDLVGGRQPRIIHLSGEGEAEMEQISREIDIFIKSRVGDIGARHQLELEDEDLLLQKLTGNPHRTYLWIYLVLNLIEGDIDTGVVGISEATAQASGTVYDAYERILSRSRNFEKTKKLLKIVVAAARPLSLEEMCLALALQDNHQSYKDLHLETGDRFQEHIRELCGFLIVIKDLKIYLLHQTLKEFLVQDYEVADVAQTSTGSVQSTVSNSTKSGIGCERKYSFQLQDSHGILANICIQHLLFREFEDNPLEDDSGLTEYVKKSPFLDYSAKNWTTHFHGSKSGLDQITPRSKADEMEARSILTLSDANSKRCSTWLRIYWTTTNAKEGFPEDFTTLMIASYFGLLGVAIHLLKMDVDRKIDLDFRDKIYGRSAVSWAAQNGFDYVVELLVGGIGGRLKDLSLPFRKGANVDSGDKNNQTPLSYAILHEHVPTVDILLKVGANVNLEDGFGGTPTIYGTCSGNSVITEQISKAAAGTTVDIEENKLSSLLLSAVKENNETILNVIIETGKADANFISKGFLTPLLQAVENKNETIVRLLLERTNADPNLVGPEISTPLVTAVQYCCENIVRLLLEKGRADPNLKNSRGDTPLSVAIENHSIDIIQLLLKTDGIDVNLKRLGGASPLSVAAGVGDEAIVELLLRTGRADPDSRDDSGLSPLFHAINRGNEAIARLLLETGRVDLDSKDGWGDTPLIAAAEYGNAVIIQLLLKTGGFDPNARDSEGRTALFNAIEYAHTDVLRLLLETEGVDPNLEDEEGRTPLIYALGCIKTYRFKIYPPYSKRRRRSTDTPWAQEEKEDTLHRIQDIVRLLIKTERVDPYLGNGNGIPPLLLAIEYGDTDNFQLLLESGRVDLNIRDAVGRTPLLVAISHRYVFLQRGNYFGSQIEIGPMVGRDKIMLETIIRLMLKDGTANFDVGDLANRTPLYYAILLNMDDIARILLENGADPNSMVSCVSEAESSIFPSIFRYNFD